MKMQPFTTQVRRAGEAVVIDLMGEVNAFAESALGGSYKEAESLDPSIIVLNFTEVNYINSTGIALIVSILAQARKARRRLVVYGLSEHYVTIFQITRLSDFMAIYSDEASALTAVG